MQLAPSRLRIIPDPDTLTNLSGTALEGSGQILKVPWPTALPLGIKDNV